jgi:DNA-binding transcriptional ArsR family regulator
VYKTNLMARRKKARSKAVASPADPLDLVFKALANAERRLLLEVVRRQPRTSSELCEQLPDLDRCTVMLHLRVLESAQLLTTKKVGRCKLHTMNVEPVQRLYDGWIKRNLQPAASK